MTALRFNYALSPGAHVGDQVDDLRDQLRALGHEFVVVRGTLLPPPWFNILQEGADEMASEETPRLMRAGYQVVALLTEQPTLVTAEGLVWNHFTLDPTWEARARRFVELAPLFVAAWCYAPGAAAAVRRFVPRAADIEMAWGQRFLAERPAVAPIHDFCFFGAPTERRLGVIDEFRRRGRRVDVVPHSWSLTERDARIPLSKIVLDIKQHHWWSLVSSARYVAALQAGRAVVAESRPAEARARWGAVVRFAPEGDFVGCAERALDAWYKLAEAQAQAFRRVPGMMAAAVAVLPAPTANDAPPVEVQPPRHDPTANGHKSLTPKLLGSVNGSNLVGWRGSVYAIPQILGTIHLEKIKLRDYPAITAFPDYVSALKGLE